MAIKSCAILKVYGGYMGIYHDQCEHLFSQQWMIKLLKNNIFLFTFLN